jgi:tRNA-Thr(GGU) m(6)t(6)A37 methyltransferase TsaA
MKIIYEPIGVIRTPFTEPHGMPIQPTSRSAGAGTAEVDPRYEPGMEDLDGFSHVILIYHLHRAGPAQMTVRPFLDREPRGIFATRAPARPNPIGFSVVRLVAREANVLHLEQLDILDGTPLLDIKPYVPAFDAPAVSRVGWLEETGSDVAHTVSDDRFSPPSDDGEGVC